MNIKSTLVVAACATPILIFSGMDWEWAKLSYQYLVLQYIGIPSVFIGMIIPFVWPLYLYLNQNKEASYGLKARVLGRAFLAAWGFSTILKAFTNRVPREPFEDLGLIDFSQQFRFGWLQGNNLWESLIEGFPSGHTMTAFAMSFAIRPFLASSKAQNGVVIYALYIGLGVSFTVHWLSDAVAGGLIGYALGNLSPYRISITSPLTIFTEPLTRRNRTK